VLLTRRPGRVGDQFEVGLPRPRRIEAAEVAALAGHVTDELRREVARHGGH
jgi:NitT/TauT family transport system ATP-binding protein